MTTDEKIEQLEIRVREQLMPPGFIPFGPGHEQVLRPFVDHAGSRARDMLCAIFSNPETGEELRYTIPMKRLRETDRKDLP